MKKTGKRASAIAFLLALALLIAFVPAPRAYASDMSGECGKDGDNLTWSYSGGVLVISGKGEMADYEERSDCPWYDVRDDIERVELPEGLESIGDKAFARCKRLSSVLIPESVTSIGDGAFEGCWDNSVESADGSVPGPEFTVGQGSSAERYRVENGLKYRYA